MACGTTVDGVAIDKEGAAATTVSDTKTPATATPPSATKPPVHLTKELEQRLDERFPDARMERIYPNAILVD